MGNDWNLLDPILSATLLRLCVEGYVDAVVGGPPCSTHSLLRFIELGYRGAPRPLRFRGRWAWGRSGLNTGEAKQAREANQLIFLYLSMAEAVCANGGWRLLKHPADQGADPYPYILGYG